MARMAKPWFRMYHEFLEDPKVLMLEEKYRYRLVALLCAKCKYETLKEKEMPIIFRLSQAETQATKDVFLEAGFIDADWNVRNWDKRQYEGDHSKERMRNFRERKTAGVQNVTFQ